MGHERASGEAMEASDELAATVAREALQATLVAPQEPPPPRPAREGGHLEVGARVGRYVVVRELGAGGVGVVFAAYDPELDRKVALKLLRPELAGGRSRSSDEARTRFVREAHALARLSHPNVVPIYDVGEHEGGVWLAMEHVHGVTLEAWLAAAPRTMDEILEVLIAAGRGLEAAHQAGLLHRDFKPENVMVGDDGRTRVMDLGLARGAGASGDEGEGIDAGPPPSVSASDIRVTRAGALVGTPAYMSPEQFAGRESDVRSDIFAYCVTLYEALYGERPFPGDTLVALASNVLRGKIGPPPRGRAVPGWLRRVCVRGLAVEPEQRFASMSALLDAIDRGQVSARRRRWGAAALGLAALFGGFALADYYEMSQKTAMCEAEGAVIDEVWSDDARERLRAGLLATGAPFAADSLEILVPWLDAYGEAWRAGRREACGHRAIAGDWDEALFDRASWCFEDRRLQLEATIDQIATLSRASARRAVRIASYLDPVATCLDPSLLQRLPAPPLEMRDAIRAIRAALSESDRLRYGGRFDEALAVAAEARARAEALRWSPLRALARFIEGRSAFEAGRSKEAEETLLWAFFEAQHDGSVEVAFRAARTLIIVYTDLQRFHEAQVWARHADVLAVSRSDPSGLDAAEGLYLESLIYAGLGDYDAAATIGEEALAMRQAALGADHPITAASIRNLGIVYLAQGRSREALDYFDQAAAIWEIAVGHEHPYIGQIATYRGQALAALGEVDAALVALREGVAIHERLFGSAHPRATVSNHALVEALLALGRADEAEPMILRDLEAARAKDRVEPRAVAEVLLQLAAIDRLRGRDDDAIARGEEALALLEAALDPDHPDIAAAIERVAAIEEALGRRDAAITRRRQALARREASFGGAHGQLREPLVALGDALLAAGRHDEARAAFAQAQAIGERLFGPTHAALVPSLSGLARVALAEGDRSGAAAFAERAVALAEAENAGPRQAAPAHFALAQALGGRGPLSERARALAAAASREFAIAHDEARQGEVERWLAARPG